MSHPEYVELQRKKAIAAARQNPKDGIALLLTVCQLNAFLYEPELERRVPVADRLFLKGVSSEVDGLPLGEERQYWAPSALEEKDKLSRSYADRIREDVLAAFGRIAGSLE